MLPKTCLRAVLLLAAALSAQAAAYLYQFSGTVTGVSSDPSGLAARQGWTTGTPVQLAYVVDFSQRGYGLTYAGTPEYLDDLPAPGEHANFSVHWFYAALQGGGSALFDPAAEALRPAGQYLSRNYGSDHVQAGGNNLGALTGGGVSYTVQVSRWQVNFLPPEPIVINPDGTISGGGPGELPWGTTYGSPRVADWQAGDRLVASFIATDAAGILSGGYSSVVKANVTLTAITAVPEPGSVALLVAGVVLGALWLRPRAKA